MMSGAGCKCGFSLKGPKMLYADNCCKYTEQFEPEHAYIFTGPCIETGQPYSVTVPARQLNEYRRGLHKHIQDAFPEMSAGDREFLMSGISPEAFDALFKEEEEEEEEDSETRTIQNWNKSKTCTLSNEVYEIKTNSHELSKYKSGTKVRLISGVDDNPIPGYHFMCGYVTVCRIDAEHAEFLGFKSEELELLGTDDDETN